MVMSPSHRRRDMAALASALEWRDPGIWFARTRSAISYPEGGNAACLQVEERSFWFRHRNRCIVSVVRRYFPGGLFLDIGGGNGYVAKGLIDAGVDCALVEPGIEGAIAARARGVSPVVCASLEDSGFRPGSIAAAGLFDVLEHIEDQSGALARIHEILSPGGRLFMTVPAYPFLFSADDEAAGHYRRYTLSSLSRVLVTCGFRAEFASYMFAPLPPVVLALRTIPSRLGLKTGASPERDASDHAPGGAAARLLHRALEAEFRRIDSGRTLPAGGSCLCVAVKN